MKIYKLDAYCDHFFNEWHTPTHIRKFFKTKASAEKERARLKKVRWSEKHGKTLRWTYTVIRPVKLYP